MDYGTITISAVQCITNMVANYVKLLCQSTHSMVMKTVASFTLLWERTCEERL